MYLHQSKRIALSLAFAGLLIAAYLAAAAPTARANPGIPFAPAPAVGAAYYVRADGGSAERCTGLVDAPDPGSGTNQPCAWDHPFRALPPGGAPRIAGGDTLRIGPGSYRMGFGAPEDDNCDAGGAYDCLMPPIPSGPSPANPTRILGDSQNPPELWGAERPWFIVNLTDSSNVELGYLEITDHSGCVEFHSGSLPCERDNPPYGDWASYGLYAEDSANVYLHDLDIHGLAAGGVHAGRLTDWTVERVRVAGNGSVGWDGDLWDALGDSNSGDLIFRHWTVEWNGCGETYPGGQPAGCWAQTAGGYGDGFATGESGGHWLIEDSVIRYNTSDGLDFLYIREAGSSITIRRTLLEGNAGSQVKNFRGPFLIENSIIVGNCGFFDGQPFTYNVDNCRAMGDALDLGLMAGDQVTVTNNTISGEGDCLVGAEFYDVSANGAESVLLRNNILQGQVDFLQPFENTCLIYQETFPSDPFDVDYSIINNVKDNLCPGAHDLCGVPPGLVNTGTDTFDAHLLASSPAIDAALDSAAPPDDFDGNARDAQPDIGAYEYGATPPPTPTSTRTPTVTSPGGAGVFLPIVVRAGAAVATPTPTPTPTSTSLPTGAVMLITIGDSLTEGDGDEYGGGGFPGRLLPLVQNLRPGSTLTNLGHSGWDTYMVINGNDGELPQLSRAITLINQALAAGQIPIVTVWIGSNDLWYLYQGYDPTPADEAQELANFTANIDTILSQLTGAGATVLIALLDDQSLRPVCADPAMRALAFPGISDAEVALMSQQVVRYNTAIASKAAEYGATTVDFYNTTIFTNWATLNEDGNHPNAAGYDLITQIWFDAISPLLQ